MSLLSVLEAPSGQEINAETLARYKASYDASSGDGATADGTGNIRTVSTTFQRQTIVYALVGVAVLLWLASRK